MFIGQWIGMSSTQSVREEDSETQRGDVLEVPGRRGRERSVGKVEAKGKQRRKQE